MALMENDNYVYVLKEIGDTTTDKLARKVKVNRFEQRTGFS